MTATYLVLLLLGAALATAFPIYYHLRARWRATQMGRHLMAFMLVLALLLDLTVVGTFWPRPWLAPVAVVMFAAFDALLAQRLWLLVQAQRPRR